MWSCQLVTSGLNYFPVLCPCNTVVVFEMYSLIGSLVVMHDCEAGALTGMFVHSSRFKYGRFRHQMGLRAVQKQFPHVSIARTLIACASSVKCNLDAHIKHLHVLSGLSSPRRPLRVIQSWQDYHESPRSMQWCIFLGVSCWKHLTCSTSRNPSDRLIGDPGMVHLP